MLSTAEILKAKILIVDDLEANIHLLMRMLGEAGYSELTSAKDPHSVSAMYKENHYDLILLDLVMPEMDGFEVIEALKEIDQDSYVPVLVITVEPAHKLRALQAGAKDFISKPFEQKELLARVHNLLEVRLLHRKAKECSEELQQKIKELEASHAVIRSQSKELAIRAEAGNRAKREFLTNMSHELRTPLNGVIGMIQLLKESPLNDEQHGYADIVYESGQSLLTSINDILNYERIEQKTLAAEEQDFDLAVLIQSLVSRIAAKAREKQLQIITELDPTIPPSLFGNGVCLQEILQSLCDNALKFTTAGKITLSVGCLSQTSTKINLCFNLVDTGIGIAPEQIETIFQPFTQADGSASRVFGGKGLGLSIAKELVELMGGQLECQSQVGLGSTFSFSLCLTLPEAKTMPLARFENAVILRESPSEKHQSPHILLVEDNKINQVVAASILARLGFRTDISSNGREALAALKQTNYDLILMDCQMPEMDGYQATQEIRRGSIDGINPAVPIIAVTAHVLEGDRSKCLDAGMNDYLPKPFTSEQLAKLLSRWLPLPNEWHQADAPRASSSQKNFLI